MPELWELCNNTSKATLIQLYWNEHGEYPEWYLILIGELEKPVPHCEIPVGLPENIEKFMQSNSDIKARVK